MTTTEVYNISPIKLQQNYEIDHKYTVCSGVGFVHLADVGDHGQTHVKPVMNILFS
jgi:hypothetical protein